VSERLGSVRDVHPSPVSSERALYATVLALSKRSQSRKNTCATNAYGEYDAPIRFHRVCIRTRSSEKASANHCKDKDQLQHMLRLPRQPERLMALSQIQLAIVRSPHPALSLKGEADGDSRR
jgi:hypothetical protein